MCNSCNNNFNDGRFGCGSNWNNSWGCGCNNNEFFDNSALFEAERIAHEALRRRARENRCAREFCRCMRSANRNWNC